MAGKAVLRLPRYNLIGAPIAATYAGALFCALLTTIDTGKAIISAAGTPAGFRNLPD